MHDHHYPTAFLRCCLRTAPTTARSQRVVPVALTLSGWRQLGHRKGSIASDVDRRGLAPRRCGGVLADLPSRPSDDATTARMGPHPRSATDRQHLRRLAMVAAGYRIHAERRVRAQAVMSSSRVRHDDPVDAHLGWSPAKAARRRSRVVRSEDSQVARSSSRGSPRCAAPGVARARAANGRRSRTRCPSSYGVGSGREPRAHEPHRVPPRARS